MPTTVVALALYPVLLFPGYVANVRRHVYLPRRVQSSFLETVNLIAVSVVTNGITLGLFAIARSRWPEHTPDLSRWVTQRSAYANPRLGYLALWSVGALAVSSAIALVLAGSWVRKVFGKYFNPAIAEVSTWYHIFEHPPKDKAADATYAYVECFLTDNSYAAGRLTWYSTEIDETEDRDLALVAPPSPSEQSSESPSVVDGVVRGNSILILSARDIRRMVVTWVDIPPSASSTEWKPNRKSVPRPQPPNRVRKRKVGQGTKAKPKSERGVSDP